MGERKRLSEVTRYQRTFPGLNNHQWQVTSEKDRRYNCIAWALGINNKFYWPDSMGQYYWPRNIPRNASLESFVSLFREQGFGESKSALLNKGVEKIALFAFGSDFRHAARQLPNGLWSSKLGNDHDIEHELNGLEGDEYGKVSMILERKVSKI